MAEINEVRTIGGGRTTQPTMGLRLMNGALQQAWLVVRHGEVGQELERHIEWRNVPDESTLVPNGERA